MDTIGGLFFETTWGKGSSSLVTVGFMEMTKYLTVLQVFSGKMLRRYGVNVSKCLIMKMKVTNSLFG